MVVGFTGTRQGMTPAQKRVVKDLLGELSPVRVVHGDCVGADADFHAIATELGIPIYLRPGHNVRGESPTRAYCEGADYAYLSRNYLQRDEDIVKDADKGDGVLIACPSGMNEVLRSGTWATIRRARKRHVPQYIVGPDGVLI
jgi:hypothetical protein